MKKQTYMSAIIITLITVAGLSSAKAQTSGPTILQVDIPFAFSVGNQKLPAGEYRVNCVSTASDSKILQLRDQSGHNSVLVHTSTVVGKSADKAKLVFNRYGDQYFFAQAWLPGDNLGMEARKSRIEKVTAREQASIQRAFESVALTLKR